MTRAGFYVQRVFCIEAKDHMASSVFLNDAKIIID